MMSKKLVLLLPLLLSACAAHTGGRDECAANLDSAWQELDLAKAEGFAGTVSYTKALGLLSLAKGQQQIERYPSCIEKAKRARFYISESRQGR
ncbi:hypothetical protein [Gallaecimonas pentaromativorans]|uniref:Lipoprotein n=1 Tax=Gallaecimonas pentaromativorans TaxID=584787 RepID=A0A3N1PC29_9GAMM|nr:hypothetical protein EDC28_106189 [Gallaecimonas pentaromativorans]